MKYMAILDAYEKPVSCDFIGCNGNVTPYLIGSTTDIKELEQEPSIDELRVEITALQNRCYALTKGVMCGFCNYECQYKVDRSVE